MMCRSAPFSALQVCRWWLLGPVRLRSISLFLQRVTSSCGLYEEVEGQCVGDTSLPRLDSHAFGRRHRVISSTERGGRSGLAGEDT